MERIVFLDKYEMTNLLATPFTIKEKMWSNVTHHNMGEIIEILVNKFDQQKYEMFISSGSTRSKAARCYHRVILDMKISVLMDEETSQW